jgi:tetratricopeptide (TPR) repeat protein
VSAVPSSGSGIELRLSFLKPRGAKPEVLNIRGDGQVGVDFWWPEPAARRAATRRKVGQAPAPLNSVAPKQAPGQILDLFENNQEWDRILGAAVTAMDLNSPELNRFRLPQIEVNTGLPKEYIERQSLAVPSLGLPRLDQSLVFAPEPLNLEDFKLEEIPAISGSWVERDRRRALEAANLVVLLMRRGDWGRAERSMDVFLRSDVAGLAPQVQRWRVLRPKIVMELGRQAKDRGVIRRGLDLYRDALRELSGRGDLAAGGAEYLLLESLREMASLGAWYNAASLLAWSNRYSWSDRVVERLQFLRAEAFFQLGFYNDAKTAFQDFFDRRSVLPISAAFDRRLVPFAGFRLGDTAFARADFAQAAELYSQSLSQVPSLNKLSFEGLWLPEEVRIYPQILFNRAESFVRLGREADALKDLRAFLFVAPAHSELGLVLFRVGSLLQRLGAPDDVQMGAWRECVFKVPRSLGARLCEASRAAVDLKKAPESQWPRIIGRIETASPRSSSEPFWGALNRDDLEVYVDLLRADAFLHLNRPMQALVLLEPLATRAPTPKIKTWLEEYTVAALSGVMADRIERKQYRQVVEDYESRRTQLFFRFVRPEILFRVAQAYEGLGLWDLSAQSLALAESSKAALGRKIPRPFDPTEEDWSYLTAHLLVQRYQSSSSQRELVERALKKLAPQDRRTLEYRVLFYSKAGDRAQEAEAWADWEQSHPLSWEQLERWTQLLSDLDRDSAARSLLETRVGAWFLERNLKTVQNVPPPTLVFRLAALRAKLSSSGEALPLMEYLLGLDAAALGSALSRPMLLYRKGEYQQASGLRQEARRTFEQAIRSAPESLWGRLSARAARDLETLETPGGR